MARGYRGVVLEQLQRIFDLDAVSGLSEEHLLERFVARQDVSAFEAIVLRHGPMVWGVCRRLLSNTDDAEDAFQATFLVLLKRAGSLRDPSRLSPWLHGVAFRVASRARTEAACRARRERDAAKPGAVGPEDSASIHEVRTLIDEELNRLPDKHRHPLILCDIEGLSYQEAASRLQWTEGMLRGRLARARARLRSRFSRRGLAPSATLAIASVGAESSAAAVPAGLVAATVAVAKVVSLGESVATTTVATAVITLAEGALSTMLLSKLKLMAGAAAIGTLLLVALPFAFALDEPGPPASDKPKPDTHQPSQAALTTAPNPKVDPPAKLLELRVVSQRSGEPLRDVALEVSIDSKVTITGKTNQEGRYSASLPLGTHDYVRVKASREGFVPMSVAWDRGGVASIDIPKDFQLFMEPGTTIGGVVQNTEGRPIAGATVFVLVSTNRLPDQPAADVWDYPAITDAQGRWHCNVVPSKFDDVSLRLQHPDYQSDTHYGSSLKPPLAQLRDRTGVMVMAKGLPVSGQVLDQLGRPIAGATVRQGTNYASGSDPKSTTNADGRFEFPHVAPGELILTVQATGHAPELKRVDVTPAMAPVEFRLGPGHLIRGRVVDTESKPVAEAWIVADGWREYRSLVLETRSKADGTFEFRDAPADVVRIQVAHADFMNQLSQVSAESKKELLVKLNRRLSIEGSVVDAESGKPIKSFNLVVGEDPSQEPTYWDDKRPYRFQGGRYKVTFRGIGSRSRGLKIEAEGYLPAISRSFTSTESSPVYDFKLKRGTISQRPAISGVVYRRDGSPVTGADVHLATKSRPIHVSNGKGPNYKYYPTVRSDTEGRFTFPPQSEEAIVLVLDPQGYAKLTEEELRNAQGRASLTPWGRIEGTLRVGNKPGSLEVVSAYHIFRDEPVDPRVDFSSSSVADASGRFALERVLPGEAWVARRIQLTPHSTGSSASTRIAVESDHTAKVTLGGIGRPVTGRIVKSATLDTPIELSSGHYTLRLKAPDAPVPNGLTKEQRAEWFKTWYQTEAGKARKEAVRSVRVYSVKLESDNSFRIEDVLPGTYELLARVHEFSGGGPHVIAGLTRTVTIPEIPEGRSDVPLELGPVELREWEQLER